MTSRAKVATLSRNISSSSEYIVTAGRITAASLHIRLLCTAPAQPRRADTAGGVSAITEERLPPATKMGLRE
eukprot:861475-Rhodomonas_salina.3